MCETFIAYHLNNHITLCFGYKVHQLMEQYVKDV